MSQVNALLIKSKHPPPPPKQNKCKFIVLTTAMFLIIAAIVTLILLIDKDSETVSSSDVIRLRQEIRNAIDNSSTVDGPFGAPDPRPLLAAIVRLAFHDCSGRNIVQSNQEQQDDANIELTINRCNGCLDFDEPDNGGILETAVDPLETIYQGDNQWYNIMTRADFWATAATIAIEYAAELQWEINQSEPLIPPFDPAPLPDIPYYFGREDCLNSPNAVERDVFYFPDSHAGWRETRDWFMDNLGFDERETVIIIGAHTLGQARPQFSGHIDAWVGARNALNVEFYQNMQVTQGFLNIVEWEQKAVENISGAEGFGSDRYQWVIGNEEFFGIENVGRGIMMNSDLCLTLDFTNYLDRDTGIITCTSPTWPEFLFPNNSTVNTTCPLQEGIWQIVDEFAMDNAKWINEFAKVFESMIILNENVSSLQRVIVPYDRSFEE